MKKLLGIVVLGLLLSGNAYSKTLVKLGCLSSDETMTTIIVIDASNNKATVQGYPATIQVTPNRYLMKYRIYDVPADITFAIDRDTGSYNEVWIGADTLYFHGKCDLAKNKF